MKRLTSTIIASAIAIAVAVPAIAAAISPTAQKEIADLQQKMLALRKQILSKYVDAGQLPQAQADLMLKQMEQRQAQCLQSGSPVAGNAMMGGGGRGRGAVASAGCGSATGAGCGAGFGGRGWTVPAPTTK